MLKTLDDDIPAEIKNTMNSMLIAKQYNRITGANINHLDIDTLGFMEITKTELAIDLLREL